jgi:heme/copper-type cytochrome/quinol oxidase subunit 2
VLAATVIFFVFLYDFGYLSLGSPDNNAMHFTIYESDPPNPLAGMNGSYYYYLHHSFALPFPVITVSKGTTVVIEVINNESVEPHGFAIDYYYNAGTTLRPHQTVTITFVANKVGVFRIYCNVFCSIHFFMENGELNVTL